MSKYIERAAFEAWALGVGHSQERMRRSIIEKSYADLYVDNAWEGWQARAALAQEAQAVPESVPDECANSAWKSVPVDPSHRMTAIGQRHRYDSAWSIGAIYREMLAAAPQSVPAQPVAIYQTCFIHGQWRDVDRFEYERAKGLREDLARIVYTAPTAAEQDVPRALTGEQRQALGVALTNYFTAYDEGEEHEYQILSSWDYHDARNIDHLIDRVIVRALTAAGAK